MLRKESEENTMPQEIRKQVLKSIYGKKVVNCNLCGKKFKKKSKYERFCQDCKSENEAYLDYEAFDANW